MKTWDLAKDCIVSIFYVLVSSIERLGSLIMNGSLKGNLM